MEIVKHYTQATGLLTSASEPKKCRWYLDQVHDSNSTLLRGVIEALTQSGLVTPVIDPHGGCIVVEDGEDNSIYYTGAVKVFKAEIATLVGSVITGLLSIVESSILYQSQTDQQCSSISIHDPTALEQLLKLVELDVHRLKHEKHGPRRRLQRDKDGRWRPLSP